MNFYLGLCRKYGGSHHQCLQLNILQNEMSLTLPSENMLNSYMDKSEKCEDLL